jgi:pimeloyl-ACP methyl ester carboxylesterase
VYFHGAPGAPLEADVFRESATAHGLQVLCQDRFALDRSRGDEAYFQSLAADIVAHAQGKPVDVVGFSIGAFVSLQVCRLLRDQVRSLHLVSPAAPLEAGNFLDGMAGKFVFQLARNAPFLFKLLSYWQAALARFAPALLYATLFASARAGDKVLAVNSDFRNRISAVLVQCFRGGLTGYIGDVLAYVQPWNERLKEVTVPTHLWHGELDNWSPVAMSVYLSQALPKVESFTRLAGLSHYSCLYAAAPEICAMLGAQPVQPAM